MFEPECSRLRLAKLKKTEFTGVNEHFFDKRNEEIGHYGQTLVSCQGNIDANSHFERSREIECLRQLSHLDSAR